MRVADSASIASRIEQAFQTASTSTGTSFDYLVKTAARESSFNTDAKAKTSSATGLFQFIESTWLETMKESGAELGLGKYADQIQQTKSGKYVVSDPQARQEILNLRKDPEIASLMAGAFTQKNADYLTRKLGRDPSEGELYMAHFLGANGAKRLIESTQSNAEARADKLFPAQAKANKSIFYNSDGTARSNAEVYSAITSKHDAVTMIASVSPERTKGISSVGLVPGHKPVSSGSEVLAFADESQSLGENLETATNEAVSAFKAHDAEGPFQALFRNDPSSERQTLRSRFDSAFSAAERSAIFTSADTAASGPSTTLALQEQSNGLLGEGPLDLTKFLTYEVAQKKKDLLPPV
ncbi:transglycosylase SLT domain-containing protein [Roseibium litorale]|uniref:Lytic transglycosylase domain-containing protein n=1 Tax=Roseibium litorale TaxID=2803841 RepID=A0ABR9CIZ4_9HYPH|nr:transglycosylase SLT domain-containing protein [Roseibium litorale]MBD8890276.1 lytic transglycosylase domain-containing protein [Roseibium litorale]